ncbi:FixH family protein [Rummeliibacillus pycnus]|uniref:FixH family protein n=1 Tax=Rummeliibacillus pycnus TaxID=101070 RepID=UPI0037C7ACEE
MKKMLISLALIAVVLAGCNNADTSKTDNSTSHNEGTAVEVKVDIQTPEKEKVGKDIELVAHVTQGGKNVDDADEVKFEVWESGNRDQGQMLEGKLDKDGIYKASTKFDHDGVYYMYAHTTARGLHAMPKQKIVVGNPDMSKVKEDKDDGSMGMDMNDSSADDH